MISKDGLYVNWMCEEKFAAADVILNPLLVATPTKAMFPCIIESPKGVRKGSEEYYKMTLNQSMDYIQTLTEATPTLVGVPGLMPYRSIIPKESTNKHLMAHESLVV